MFVVKLSMLAIVFVVAVSDVKTEETSTTTEETTWDKVKNVYNKAYDGVHCGFHKVKELVKHHEHEAGQDPCSPKQDVTRNIYGVDAENIDVPTTIKPLQ